MVNAAPKQGEIVGWRGVIYQRWSRQERTKNMLHGNFSTCMVVWVGWYMNVLILLEAYDARKFGVASS